MIHFSTGAIWSSNLNMVIPCIAVMSRESAFQPVNFKMESA